MTGKLRGVAREFADKKHRASTHKIKTDAKKAKKEKEKSEEAQEKNKAHRKKSKQEEKNSRVGVSNPTRIRPSAGEGEEVLEWQCH
jgi:hypothetical protein